MKFQQNANTQMQRVKRVVSSRYFVLAMTFGSLIPLAAYASTIGSNGMYHFVAGTVIDPDEVNANFDYFANAITVKNGNVGIGTTTPDGQLEVYSNDNDNIKLTGGSVVHGVWVDDDKLMLGGWAGGSSRLTIKGTTGNVGIGTTSPSERLQVNGNILASGTITEASDLRLKTYVLPLENAGEGIACLEGVTYRWKDPDASQDLQIGLIAQEVEKCFPEVVTTAPDGYKSVSYARLVAPLIENAKEQQAVNTAQQKEIATMKAQLAKIETLLSARR